MEEPGENSGGFRFADSAARGIRSGALDEADREELTAWRAAGLRSDLPSDCLALLGKEWSGRQVVVAPLLGEATSRGRRKLLERREIAGFTLRPDTEQKPRQRDGEPNGQKNYAKF